MSNQDLTNRDEVPMENLFQEASQDYREPVNEKDFDQFMNQLEDTGFFKEEKSGNKPFILLLSAVLLAGLLFVCFWVYKNRSSEVTSLTKEKISNSANSSVVTNEGKTEDTMDTSTSTTKVKSTVKVVDKKSEKQTSTINSVNNNITPIVIPDEAKTVIVPVIAKDTVNAVVFPEKTKAQKDSVRIRYVMAVDTVRTVDTTNIKKKSKKGKSN